MSAQSEARPANGRRTRPTPKGRQVEPAALEEVRALLGDRPRRRDLLLEHLHLIQDARGCLPTGHLAALAQEMRLALAEVYEVASFYAHFDIVDDGQPAPPPVTVRVCDGVACMLAGAEALIASLPARLGAGVRVKRAPCMGACHRAPAAHVGHGLEEHATADTIAAAVSQGRTQPVVPDHPDLAAYRAAGGYRLLSDHLEGRRTADALIATMEAAGLRGLGGAGFPTGLKWKLVRREPGPRLMAVNADEGEPGTFKDRHYLETDPHRFIEGMLLAAFAVEATDVHVYLRDEYPHIHAMLRNAFAEVEAAGLARHTRIHLRRGAGAYICGEESAMLESIEGKRPLPRNKPPYPSTHGLFGRPTLVNNVETLFWVRDIVERGPEWWTGHGRNGRQGLRSFSVSGRVRVPGVKLAPAGISLRDLVDTYCGGMAEGHRLKAFLPGGASGGILPASLADEPLDFGTLERHGAFIGSAAVVVLSEQDDLRAVALNLLRFFRDESCGQCTPCRVGTDKAVGLLARPRWDVPLLEDLAMVMGEASICGLGQAAMNPVKHILRFFPELVEGPA